MTKGNIGMATKMTGARLFGQILKAYGVTHLFFMDAVLRRALAEMEDTGIQRILGHSEKAVAYMADGYARVSGRPGVCLAQSVGAANLASGMQDPWLGHSAVVAFTGRHVSTMQYRNAYQEVDHQQLYSAVTKFHAKIEALEQMQHVMRQAFREATTGTPRPVHIDMAGYAGDAITHLTGEFEVTADDAHTRFPAFRPAPNPTSVLRAASAIRAAKRPVIIADRGAAISDAGATIAKLGEKIQAPVLATPDAKAILPENHPMFFGTMGLYGRTSGNKIVSEADLVIYCGSNTSDHTTGGYKMPKDGTPIIQIDLDPVEIGRNYSGVIGVQADVRMAVDAITVSCEAARHDEWMAAARKHVEAWRVETEKLRQSDAVPINPGRLCKELSELLPKDAILFADTGFAALWSNTMVWLTHPTQRYFRAAGSLGWAFPAALGGKCGAPDKTVVCFTGDGGFFYHLPELETARRRNIKTITIVNNNQCLAQGLKNLSIAYGNTPEPNRKNECYEFLETDFAQVARAFGCVGLTVEKPQEFRKAFETAMASALPVVIDCKTEFAAQAPMPWVPA
jgi:acetolactate synthase-1/2/3 large subunit